MYNKFAICGSSTPVLRAYASLLRANGLQVVRVSEADLTQPLPVLAEKLNGCYAVCNMAGAPYVAKWTDGYQFDIYSSRLMAIRALANAMKLCEQRPQVFVCVSNAMVYDPYEVHDEFSSAYGDTFISEVGQMETHEALAMRSKLDGVRLVIVRSGYVMYDSKGGIFPLLSKISGLGLGGFIDDGYQCLPVVHIDDMAQAVFNLSVDIRCEGIYNVTIPEMVSMRELVDVFTTRLRRRQRALPKFILRMALGEAVSLLEQNCKVIPARLTKTGFTFKHPNIDSIIDSLLGGK